MILMFDGNVGEMPMEIFGDYVSDCLGMDFPWEYIVPILNSYEYRRSLWRRYGDSKRLGDLGHGFGVSYWTQMGCGLAHLYGVANYCSGHGMFENRGCSPHIAEGAGGL